MRPLVRLCSEILSRRTPEPLLELQVDRRKLLELKERFRRGLARALGVPPEAIRKDIADAWLLNFLKAVLSPEYYEKIVSELKKKQ